MKKSYRFKLATIEAVKNFVSLASKVCGDITLSSGRWIVDGKSILGVFSLNLINELDCEIEAADEQVSIFEEGLRNLKLVWR